MDDDIDYNELFGVSPEVGGAETAGGTEEQPAGGAGTQPSAQGQTPAPGVGVSDSDTTAREPEGGQGPAQENVPDSDTIQEPGQETEPGGAVIRPSGEQPARQPAAAQYEAVIARAQADAQRAIDEAFKASGMRNPYTGQPITSKAEYDAYKERFDAERREQLLKKSGMSDEEFQQFVQDLPEVRKAKEAQVAAEKAQQEAREVAARVKLDEQIREIGAIDPSIKSLEDLAKMPTYPRFYELVQRGNTLTDAFRLANFDALTQRAAAGARQAAANAARSKEHLEPTRSRGTGAVSVPAEVREQYLLFNPGATDEEIQKHYQKNHKEA